jgi:dolichyl-phosphate beta-glucosyltransferase
MSRMSAVSLSIVIPAFNEARAIGETLETISSYFHETGLGHEVIVVDDGSSDATAETVRSIAASDPAVKLVQLGSNQGKGAAVRRGVHEAQGDVVAFIDADLPYRVQNLGDAIALVQSGAADIVIGGRDLRGSQHDSSYPLLRRFMGKTFSLVVTSILVPDIPDTQCGLKAFSATAVHLLFSESKLNGFGFDFEVLFLAKKYGFRIERIPVVLSHRHESKVRLIQDSAHMLLDVLRVRWTNRQGGYRAPRRCPVCFSTEVTSLTQIQKYVVRTCHRCKCRYLGIFPGEAELEALYNDSYFSSLCDQSVGYASRELTAAALRTNERRLTLLRRSVPSGARILEVGAGTGLFGTLAAREFQYVGIDLSEQAVAEARQKGLEVVRASLERFVNLGAPFDAITLFHVFEHLADPHDALARIKDLLKPGGVILLITPDTESLLCSISGDKWVSYKFPEHLILYSRSAVIELLEHSGFEVLSAGGDYEYCDRDFILSRLGQLRPLAAAAARPILNLLPSPLPVTSGSIRLVARRRAGSPVNMRAIPTAVEATQAR